MVKFTIKAFLQKGYFRIVLLALVSVSCSDEIHITRTLNTPPVLFPDYTDVTVPYNIAPLYFKLVDSCDCKQARALFEVGTQRIEVKAKNEQFSIPFSSWKKLMKAALGSSLRVTIQAKIQGEWVSYPSFGITVAAEPIDPYLVYRLIEPGYEIWNEMGIYQRCLENFNESVIINNKHTGYNCMNCHSFCMQNPDKMLFHIRAAYPGTILIDGNRIEKLNTKTKQTISALVYPSWHPSGKYVAFSVNDTKQVFHTTDPNRVEVLDLASDVVVYDVSRHEIITDSLLSSNSKYETFPNLSPAK